MSWPRLQCWDSEGDVTSTAVGWLCPFSSWGTPGTMISSSSGGFQMYCSPLPMKTASCWTHEEHTGWSDPLEGLMITHWFCHLNGPFFRLCPTEGRKKVHVVWNAWTVPLISYLLVFVSTMEVFCELMIAQSRYVRRIESQWLKRERNTPPVWMINTSSRWMATVFAAIYFPGWSHYLLSVVPPWCL